MSTLALRRALVAAALCLGAIALAQVPVPALTARVTDLTNTLTAQQRAALEERLAAFETRKGSQIAVLIVPTTAPETTPEETTTTDTTPDTTTTGTTPETTTTAPPSRVLTAATGTAPCG